MKIFFACLYSCVLPVCTVIPEARRRCLIPWILKLGLQIIVSCHMDSGIKPVSSGRAASGVSH